MNDAFGSAHRAHASTEGIVHHVKEAAAGLLMAAEVEYLGRILEQPGSAVRRGARRREGVGQARGDREPDPAGRRAAHRRRDGLHVLQGARAAGGHVARRGGPARRGARRRAAREGAEPALRAAGRSRRRAEARSGCRRPRRSTSAIRRSAIAWGSTSGRRRSTIYRDVIAGREDRHLERADGRVRDRRVRARHDRGREGRRRREGDRPSSAAAIRSPRSPRPASRIASPTSRPAAAPRSSSSAAGSCPESSRWGRVRRT